MAFETSYVVVGYQKERVMDHFEDGIDFGVNITYIEQNELLGTAHALRKAEPYVDEEFLVVNGDNLIDSRAIKELISAKGDNVILAALRQHTGDYGVLMVEQQRVKAIIEKPGGLAEESSIQEPINSARPSSKISPERPSQRRGSYELTETISQMIKDGKEIVPLISKGIWADAIFAWDLLNANSLALSIKDTKISGEVEEGARLQGSRWRSERAALFAPDLIWWARSPSARTAISVPTPSSFRPHLWGTRQGLAAIPRFATA